MGPEPAQKRAIAFIDGQNLFHHAKDSFGYSFPNYDPWKLASLVCQQNGWQLRQVRFYTGVPDACDNVRWNDFWTRKLAAMGKRGIEVYSRPLRYRPKTVRLPDGTQHSLVIGEEKGIDVRLAVDIIRNALRNEYDVAVIFSQDQDFSEVAREIREIAKEQSRWIKVASAYPCSPASRNKRGVNGTDWKKLEQAMYDLCIDPTDYRTSATAPGTTGSSN